MAKAILHYNRMELESICLAFSILVYISCTWLHSRLLSWLQSVFRMESLWLSMLLPVYFFRSHSNESSYLLPLLLPLDFTQINTHLSDHKLRVFQPQLSLQNCLESFFFSLSNSHLNFHNIYMKTFILNPNVFSIPSHPIDP